MYTAKLAAIGEAENAFVQLERYIYMDTVFGLIRAAEEISCPGEPNELAIEAKVNREQATVETEKQVFPAALNTLDPLPFREIRELRRFLRFRGARVKDVDATNPTAHDERTQSASDGLYFRKFGHSS